MSTIIGLVSTFRLPLQGSGKVGLNQRKVPERAEKPGSGKRESRPKSGKSARKGRKNRQREAEK